MAVSGVDNATDWVAELLALCARYKLDRVPAPTGYPMGSVAVTWMTDDGPRTEVREGSRELVLYLRALFWLDVHKPDPRLDTAYTVGTGPRTGRLLDQRFVHHCWPAEAICRGCGQMVRKESADEPWVHTGRKPGEDAPR